MSGRFPHLFPNGNDHFIKPVGRGDGIGRSAIDRVEDHLGVNVIDDEKVFIRIAVPMCLLYGPKNRQS